MMAGELAKERAIALTYDRSTLFVVRRLTAHWGDDPPSPTILPFSTT